MKKLKRWLPAFVVMAILFYLSSRQGTPLAPTHFWNYVANKAAHIIWFSLLCLSFFRATKHRAAAISLTTLYGALDEFHQSFIPTRTASGLDLIVDFAAACLVGFILWKFYPRLPKTLKNWLEA